MGLKGCLARLWIGCVLVIAASLVASSTCQTGWKNPSDNDCHGGWYAGCGWHDAGGGETPNDGDWAWTDGNGKEHEYDSYGFSLASTVVIVGFEVDIRGYSLGGGGGIQVGLSWNGGSTVDIPGGAVSPWSVSLPVADSPAGAAWRSVSIPNKPFAHTFLPSEVNSNSFTVWVKANVFGTAVYVDAVQVSVVYYDETTGPNTPLNPGIWSTTHTVNTWYGPNNPSPGSVDLEWDDASDRPTCPSGILGYQFYWDASATTAIGGSTGTGWWLGDDNSVSGMAFGGTEDRWAHIRPKDNAGNWADATLHYGPFRSDETEPTDPTVSTSHDGVIGQYTNDATVEVTLAGGSDAHSGVDGYEIVWNHSATWTQANVKTDEAEAWSNPKTYALADGSWYFHLATSDNVGNWTESPWPGQTVTVGAIRIDTTTPSDPVLNSSSHTVGATSNDPDIVIGVATEASDPLAGDTGYKVASGIDGFEIAFNQSATWTPSRTKTDEETWDGETFHATAEGSWYVHLATKDVAGNWTTTVHYGPFLIDSTPPQVTSVVASDTLITDADAGTTWTVTVVFDEAMETGVTPTLTFAPGVATTLALNAAQSGWSGSTTYVAKYTVADAGVEAASVTIDVLGAQDAAGNPQQDYTPGHELAVDTVNPAVTSVSCSDTLITDADDAGVFTVTVEFSEAMTANGSADPTLTFAPGIGTTLSFVSDDWPDSDTYTATYAVADAGVDHDSVTIDVTGAEDAVGNPQQNYVPQQEFEIDTVNPTVQLLYGTDALITDADVGDGTSFAIYAHFSEPMDTDGGCVPTVTFAPDVDSTLPAATASEFWYDDAIYAWGNGELDAGVDVDSVSVDIDGACDEHGNPMAPYSPGSEFAIDTLNPTVPTGPLPADGSYTQDTTPTISWSASSDPGGDIAGYYRYTNYLGLVTTQGSVPGTSYTCTAYAPAYELQWKVRAQDAAGNWSAYSPTYTLYVDSVPPVITGCPSDIMVENQEGIPGAFITWTEPAADDGGSTPAVGLASFTSSHVNGGFFPLGVTTVTYSALDGLGNASTCSFDVTVNATYGVEPCGSVGFLDRGWGDDEEIPVVGELPVLAVYALGEEILGCCTLRDPYGDPITDDHINLTTYRVTLGEDFDTRTPIDAQLLSCPLGGASYCFSIDTRELAPGYLDIRLGLPREFVMWLRVELIEPEAN